MLQSICLSPQAQEGSGGKVYKPARLAGAAASLVASPEAPWRWLGGDMGVHVRVYAEDCCWVIFLGSLSYLELTKDLFLLLL